MSIIIRIDALFRVHTIRADRFLVPILIWGPNNQIRGFAETVFLAIKLNRTLLIPPFFRHTNDVNNEHASLLSPELVIDVRKLSNFISIAPYSKAVDICNGKIDTILLSRNCNTGPQYERLKEFEAYSNLTFLKSYNSNEYIKKFIVTENHHVADFFNADIRPVDHSLLQKFVSLHLPHDQEKLRDLYESEGSPCAAWVFPYRAFDFRAVGLSKKDRKHQTIAFENKRFNDGIPVPFDDFDIMRNIYDRIHRPERIRATAAAFVDTYLNGDSSNGFMAIHWRFENQDSNDGYGGKTASICKSENNRCQKIRDLYANPDIIARKMKKQLYLWDLESIYIAAPPNEATFLDQLKVKLASYGIKAFTGLDLSKELDDTCLSGDSQVFSSLEQEICSRSAGFLYSPGSSWSLNVAIERNVRNQSVYANLEGILDFGKTVAKPVT